MKAQVLLTGLGLGESPRWHDGRLWFANWGTGEIRAVDLEGRDEVVGRVETTVPYSIDWLPDGRMLVVSGQEGVLLRQEASGELAIHAELGGVFNEIVVDRRGNAYVNGGNVVVVTPEGAVREVATDIAWGNGMAITADNKTLIVAESHGNRLTAFDIGEQGNLSNRRVWAELGEGHYPDGICLDAEGAVWYADVPNQHCVRIREGGERLETVEVDRGALPACWVGPMARRCSSWRPSGMAWSGSWTGWGVGRC